MAIAYNPRIVTDNLILSLDAGNPRSYPGNGTTWTDLSGRGNTGTLTNGSLYVSTYGGGIDFDGIDDYVSTTLTTYTPYCIDIWFFNDDDINQDQIMQGNYQQLLGTGTYPGGITLGAWTSSATNETFCFFSSNWTTGGMTYIRDTAAAGIHNLVVNWNGSSYDFWLDGTKRTTYAATTHGHCVLQSRTGLELGRDYTGFYSYEFDGKIFNLKIYGSQLTDSQVQQNFNALRGRFGI